MGTCASVQARLTMRPKAVAPAALKISFQRLAARLFSGSCWLEVKVYCVGYMSENSGLISPRNLLGVSNSICASAHSAWEVHVPALTRIRPV